VEVLSGGRFHISGESNVASIKGKHDAAFIVQACNAHDDLVAALRNLVNAAPNEVDLCKLLEFSGLDDIGELRIKVQNFAFLTEKARAALAKAGAL
jgi:hypothetical protein